jgi:hypothetical protein
MARVKACDTVGCKVDGRNCDPMGKGCIIFKSNGFIIDAQGNLKCIDCGKLGGEHLGYCSAAPAAP